MITGEMKSKVDRVWDAFWSGGISNPIEVIEQITYLLFIRRLDDLNTLAEKKARMTGAEEGILFGPDQQNLRWKTLKGDEPGVMFTTISQQVFPFLRSLRSEGSTYSEHMKDARFTIPNPALLSRVVDMIDDIPMADRDTNGDLYEYLLSKIASAGVNGQFRTPRHIIAAMVAMMNPQPTDEICDPACGTAGFLVAAAEHVREQHPSVLTDAAQRKHFHASMFHGYDFDSTMLRIGSMNMLMHGVEAPDIRYRDSLSEGASGDADKYTLILANPPFAGSLDYESTSKDLQRIVKTKKTELLFLALFLKLLKAGGRAAVIVPDGVLFGSSKAHKDLRRTLVEEQKLDGIVKLPSGVFKPYAGVSTAILLFTKTNSGGTDHVWFYDVRADGFSLDDKRNPIDADDLPDVLTRWSLRSGSELERARNEQSFCVPKADIVAQDYDLSLNRYRETVHDEVVHRPPLEIIGEIEKLEQEIAGGIAELKAMLT
ncbi:type I restriction-modification system subunit M [Mycolicibacterium gilvum]|uniref:type I restriction-modification system subunit M n=1 Tax=Mycolicibacterium gilvum TaxID=1804 RepID=UPI0040457772